MAKQANTEKPTRQKRRGGRRRKRKYTRRTNTATNTSNVTQATRDIFAILKPLNHDETRQVLGSLSAVHEYLSESE